MSVEQLLVAAASAQPLKAAELRLQAATLLKQRGDLQGATRALDGVDISLLPPNLAFEVTSLRAGAAIDRNKANSALRYLDAAQFPDLNISQRVEFSRLRAQAYEQQQNPLAAALELINVAKTTQGAELNELNNLIWRQLQSVDPERLVAASLSNYGFYEQGWIELALSLAKQADLSTQRDALTQWQQLWSNHSANTNPPTALSALLNADLLTPKRILLALPFSGQLAEPARVISEGVIAAMYQRQIQNLPVPELITLDTEEVSSGRAIIDYATTAKADLIIGPLKGEFIDQLASEPALPMPVIVFNQSSQSAPNIYTLGLSSDQEITQVVERAVTEGHTQFALITPAAVWGIKAREDYLKAIDEQGAEVITELQFQNTDELSRQVAELLNTQRSTARYEEVRSALGQKIEFNARPRRDIDAILITATSSEARQFKPMLAFQFAGEYPVYATSHVFDGNIDPVRDIDLNGVQFADTPWLLNPSSSINLQLSSERSDTQSRLGRLYALGADAFTLHPFLRQLEGSKEIFFDGLTGRLTLNPDRRIQRQLVWAGFDQGIPVLLGPPKIPVPDVPTEEALFSPSN